MIGEIPGNKSFVVAVTDWKTSPNVTWARENLWNQVDENSDDQHDTYMNRIMNEVFKGEKCTTNNCAFVVAIVDLIFDTTVQTTTLSEETIVDRMNKKLNMHSDEEVEVGTSLNNNVLLVYYMI
jgi:hypothetical protein